MLRFNRAEKLILALCLLVAVFCAGVWVGRATATVEVVVVR